MIVTYQFIIMYKYKEGKMKQLNKFLAGLIMCMSILLIVPATNVTAAEYTVTEVEAVLYTNENTTILADADLNTVVLPTIDPNLPIQVTGITSNGFFRINLGGQTFYIPGIGLSDKNLNDNNTSSNSNQIYEVMIAQKAVFPEGMHWTNDNYYAWKGGIYTGGFGCAGFAFAVSDAAFGDAPARIHYDYTNIQVGDILRINNDTHSVIVLEVKENSVVVAEGNYNSSIHWGREIPKSKLVDPSSYIMTRY